MGVQQGLGGRADGNTKEVRSLGNSLKGGSELGACLVAEVRSCLTRCPRKLRPEVRLLVGQAIQYRAAGPGQVCVCVVPGNRSLFA